MQLAATALQQRIYHAQQEGVYIPPEVVELINKFLSHEEITATDYKLISLSLPTAEDLDVPQNNNENDDDTDQGPTMSTPTARPDNIVQPSPGNVYKFSNLLIASLYVGYCRSSTFVR